MKLEIISLRWLRDWPTLKIMRSLMKPIGSPLTDTDGSLFGKTHPLVAIYPEEGGLYHREMREVFKLDHFA